MLSQWSEWLSSDAGLQPHGFCLLWEPGLLWLYALSDATIALAYFTIPLGLLFIGRRRGDLVFQPMLWLFAVFILLCGATHWLDVVTLWTPFYLLQGFIKAATAVASIVTAVALWWALPRFLALPSAEELHRANAALYASQEQLAHSQKMEALGQLTGGIAHDFNNLLQVITGSLGAIEHLVAQGRGSEIEPALAAIAKASDNASSLIDRMLSFARRQTLLRRVISPDQLVAGLEELLRRTLGPGIGLELRLAADSRRIVCDPSQLESALLNLSINARDAMPHGGALTITTGVRSFAAVELESDLKPGDYVEIDVTDTGVGMSEDVLARVFEPFFTTKQVGRGTGLGLSQVYGFVRQSGGFLRIDSALGKGTSARIYLPKVDLPADLNVERESVAKADLEPTAHPHRILVVEDQGEVRSQIVEALGAIGCEVREAADGDAGLQMVKSCAPLDLLITDVGLPLSNGRQVAEGARLAQPDLPVLFITGYSDQSLDALGLDANMEILRKPFTLDDLIARVLSLLRQSNFDRARDGDRVHHSDEEAGASSST
jgi:signal transduction histidine kinase/CheY-like chemotaxis protein